MTGEELRELVTAALVADYPGLRWFHSYDARQDRERGWPDLAIAGRGGFLVAETKGPREQLSPEQAVWKWTFRMARVDWKLWRPADWESGAIRADLDRLARPVHLTH